jgi:hypothetical protein
VRARRTSSDEFVSGSLSPSAPPRRLGRVLGAIGLVSLGIIGSAVAGWYAAQSPLGQPRFETVMYLAEESVAEFYYSDEFGNIVPENVVQLPVGRGVNSVRVPLNQDEIRSSLTQRFDPCACQTPVMFSWVAVTTPLYSERIPLSSWSPAGDVTGLSPEGSGIVLSTEGRGNDPQLVFYLDIASFADRAWWVTFWVVFGLSGALVLTAVGISAGVKRARVFRANNSPSLFLSRRVHAADPKVPLSVVVVSAVFVAIAVVQQFVGGYVSGVTVDEPAHVGHLNKYFETGEYSSAAYGPATSLVAHALNVLLGVESWGLSVETAEAYANRHLVVAAIGVLGLAAAGLIAGLIFGSARWGIIAAALLGSLPLWVGHSMFNLKDVPTATGYTLVTAGLVALLSDRVAGWSKLVAGFLPIVLGVVIGAGTRPGILALMIASAIVATIVWLVFHGQRLPLALRVIIVSLVTTLGVGIGFVVVTGQTLGLDIFSAIERSIDFPWSGSTLFAGEWVSERPGLWMVLAGVVSFTPIFLTFLVGVGVIFGVVGLVQALTGARAWGSRESGLVVVSVQGFAVFVAVGILNPVLYGDPRQLLFVFPALIIFAVAGVFAILRVLPFVAGSGRVAKRLAALGLIAGLSVINFDQLRLFPYNYVYLNEIAQGPGITGRWEAEYWGSSLREGARFVTPEDPAIHGVSGTHNFNIGGLPEVRRGLSPYIGDGAEGTLSQLGDNEFWVIRTDGTLNQYGPIFSGNCTLHGEVTRPLRGEDVVMSRVYICVDN